MKKNPSRMTAAEKEIQCALTRRNFIQSLAGATGLAYLRNFAGGTALEMLTRGIMSQAIAAQSGTNSKTFIDFYIDGGFPAHYLYLVLNPYAGQTPMVNQGACNNWVGGQLVHTTAAMTANGQTINMPYLWGKTIPRASNRGGGMVSFQELFANTMILEGVNFELNSHEFCRIRNARADPTTLSLHGVAGDTADPSSIPLPVVFGEADSYIRTNFASRRASMKNVGFATGSNNSLTQLLGPVQADTRMRDMLTRRDTFSSLFQAAADSVTRDLRVSKAEGADAITATVVGAENLVRRNFGNLQTEFQALTDKYADLIQRCTNMNEIFTSAISPDILVGGNPNPLRRLPAATTVYCNNADLRTMINSTTKPTRMAEGFALAEFLVRENLSKAILIEVGSMVNLQVDGMAPQYTGFDQHEMGSAVALVVNTFMSRAFAACLNELQTRLKELGTFDNSFIRLASEFSRAPRDDLSGSDHAFGAQVCWGLSGSIHTPFVIGNIQLNSGRVYNGYTGTWGRFAKVTHEGSSNTILTTGHYISTIATALGITSPVPNSQPVVEVSSTGEILPGIDLTQIKDEG